MKLCKDCKHYSPAGAFASMWGIGAAWPASCHYGDKRDPVTGDKRIAGTCESLRGFAGDCGQDAKWFEPATLDGRLAMLD